jgi:ABC-type lipoprotein release transport system permease subunit
LLREAIIRVFPTLQVAISFPDLIAACMLGLVGGTLGALYPAYKASRMDPVRALAYE